jgi:FkbH-like protein
MEPGAASMTVNGFADANARSRELELALPATAPVYRVHFLRNYTIEGMEPFLRQALLQLGLRPQLQYAGYGTYRQDLDALAGSSEQGAPDLLVVCWVIEEFDSSFGRPDWSPESACSELLALFECIERTSVRSVQVQTFVPPFSFSTAAERDSVRRGVGMLNQCIREEVARRAPRFTLLDCSQLARQLGEDAALDYRFWYLAKAPFKPALLGKMAQEVAGVVRAQSGLAKKLLVLDCDNTLWGGVVGEDGLSGLQLDQNEYPGKAFHDFQKSILRLSRSGIVLALCSKNDEAEVLEVLDRHPACLIRQADIAAHRINWGSKAVGISEIAQQLNLGLDSVVFVDDSPYEIELVRHALPQVTCLQTPARHWLLPGLLARAGIFDSNLVTDEDQARTQRYRDDQQRQRSRATTTTLDEYLAGLQIVASITRATPESVPRVAQLLQKTNQFNLTTRRLSAFDIEQMMDSQLHAVFTLSVSDRFGDMGLVGVLIAERSGAEAAVLDLLLSCRALSRGLELALASEAIRRLTAQWCPHRWRAEYVASAKNAQAQDFWIRAGFTLEHEDRSRKKYSLRDPAKLAQPASHIAVTGETRCPA